MRRFRYTACVFGREAASTASVKASCTVWLSYALGAGALIGRELSPGDLKIESFAPSYAGGTFFMRVKVK